MINDKVRLLINSEIVDYNSLGMIALREEEPAIWAAILNYTGYNFTDDHLRLLEQQGDIINIGHIIRYRGMLNSPNMVVTDIKIVASANSVPLLGRYHTLVTGKYFNKSTQVLCSVIDKLECFEIVNLKKEDNG